MRITKEKVPGIQPREQGTAPRTGSVMDNGWRGIRKTKYKLNWEGSEASASGLLAEKPECSAFVSSLNKCFPH